MFVAGETIYFFSCFFFLSKDHVYNFTHVNSFSNFPDSTMSFEHRDRMLEGIGWKARGDRIPEFPNPRPFFPRLKHSIKLIPLFVRYYLFFFIKNAYSFCEWSANTILPFFFFFSIKKNRKIPQK